MKACLPLGAEWASKDWDRVSTLTLLTSKPLRERGMARSIS